MTTWLWRRKFTRRASKDEADPALLKELHESRDFFSEWLQQDQNASLFSLNALLLFFWGKS